MLLLLFSGIQGCQNDGDKVSMPDSSATFPTKEAPPLFEKKNPQQTKVTFKNQLDETAYRNILMYQYYYNGGGVSVGDINNDGLADIFLTGNTVKNRLYLNKGNFQFEDITDQANITPPSGPSWCTGTTMVDINNDGLLDIYVSRSGNLEPDNRRNLLYINNGDGTFTENAKAFGIDDPGYSTQAIFFDYDKDGDLDMFLINHGLEYDGQAPKHASNVRDPYVGDKLYRNDNGFFVDVSQEAGILGTKEGYGLGVSVGDLNNNGWEDIYVSNDFFEHDYLYLNNGDGTFTESIKSLTRQLSFFGMGVDIADFNNDGWQDIMVLDMAIEDHIRQKTNLAGISRSQFWQFVDKGYHYQYMFNSLQLNNGLTPDGTLNFSNIARLSGVYQTDWSWAVLFADFDNNGWKDLLITNGLRKDVMNNDFISGLNQGEAAMSPTFTGKVSDDPRKLLQSIPSEKISNYAFRNQGNLLFENVTQGWGLDEPSFSNGAAYADLDNDGDLDLIINNIDDFVSIYENKSDQSKQRFLRVKLQGNAENRFGFGTKVTLYKNDSIQVQQLNPTRGFQSSVEPILHFGVGNWDSIDSIRVEWYDHSVYVLQHVPTNMQINVDYRSALPQATKNFDKVTEAPKLFRELSRKEIKETLNLEFIHQESQYDDFSLEELLPRRYSTEGPVMISADVNGNGLDDLFFGGSKNQAAELWIQNEQGKFEKAPAQPWAADKTCEDVHALFFDADGDGDLDLYVVSGSNEFGKSSEWLQDRLYLNDGKGSFLKSQNQLPDFPYNTSKVVAGDFDGDGDLDLFVGGGVEPGAYPNSQRSYLLENQNGKFVDVTESKAPHLMQPGIVNDAVWIDYDQDGTLDLVVVGDWMPISFFKNNDGKLTVDEDFNILKEGKFLQSNEFTAGWWNALLPMLNEETGRVDFIIGNMGLNYRYKPTIDHPLEIFSGDFENSGAHNMILGYYFDGKLYPTHGREDISRSMPSIKRKFTDYKSYSRATIQDLTNNFPSPSQNHLKAYAFESIMLKNMGDGKFEWVDLPIEAQIASVQKILGVDLTGNGKKEILVAGNFFGFETKTPRDDAGVGLLLIKDETNEYRPVPMMKSGFHAPHNVRDMTTIKTKNGNYILVANNDQSIQVFKVENQARP